MEKPFLMWVKSVVHSSPLPQDKSMVTRGGIRRALGDITGQQSNVVKVGCLLQACTYFLPHLECLVFSCLQVVVQGQGKARVTRQASRRLVTLPKAMEEEPMEVEAVGRQAADR